MLYEAKLLGIICGIHASRIFGGMGGEWRGCSLGFAAVTLKKGGAATNLIIRMITERGE